MHQKEIADSVKVFLQVRQYLQAPAPVTGMHTPIALVLQTGSQHSNTAQGNILPTNAFSLSQTILLFVAVT